MYTLYIAIVIGICVLAFFGTLLVGKNVNKSIEQREVEGESPAAELQRSHKYEKNSSIKVLSIIYLITFILTAIVSAIFIF
ncbi:hypothetical protein [Pontibacillus salipaludis]|uniref:hypothetical protein n=1 Tax=Pontibacillus salipaludis TaxID=1697394 RepID=UPI0031E8383A